LYTFCVHGMILKFLRLSLVLVTTYIHAVRHHMHVINCKGKICNIYPKLYVEYVRRRLINVFWLLSLWISKSHTGKVLNAACNYGILTRCKHSRSIRLFAGVSAVRQDYVRKATGIVRTVLLLHFFLNTPRSPSTVTYDGSKSVYTFIYVCTIVCDTEHSCGT